jgi:pyruvate dehydrogenase E1 component alpha subunit
MFSRALCRGATAVRTLPKRQAYNIARRSVTTDAASSHAEKEDVPEVGIVRLNDLVGSDGNMSCANERMQEDDKPFQVKLSDESFETYELDPPPYTLDTTKKELKQMYYDMVSIRFVQLATKLRRPTMLTGIPE